MSLSCEDLSSRVQSIAQADLNQHRKTTDRLFAILMIAQWIGAILMACLISPTTWIGLESNVHVHVWSAFTLGTLVAVMPLWLAWKRPGSAATRHTIAIAQMLFSAMLIHFSGGRIETHFHIFASLAFLAIYRDWRVLITATVVIAIDHGVRGYIWPQSVYGILTSSPWRTIEHCAWVVMEDLVLIFACHQGVKSVYQIALREAELERLSQNFEQQVNEKTVALATVVDELSQSNAFLKAILDAQPSHIAILDGGGNIRQTNAAWKAFWCANGGQDEGDRDKNYLAVCEAASGACREEALLAASHIRSVLEGTSSSASLTYACHSATEQRWFTMELTPFENPHRFAVMVQRNVTEQHLAEEALRAANRENATLAGIAEKTTNAVIVTDAARKITWVNKSFERITGYTLDEVIGQSPGKLLQFKGSDPAVVKAMREALAAGQPFQGQIQNRAKDGRKYWLELDIQPIIKSNGGLDGFMAIESDITDLVHARIAAESALAEMSALRTALDEHSLLSIADRSGRIIDVNVGFCRISGYDREELLTRDHRILNSGHHPKAFWIDVWRTIARGDVWRGEVCNRAKDGSIYWVDSTIVPLLGEDGKPEKYVSLRFDITNRKKNEDELRQANEKNHLLATAVELSPGATVVTDLDGIVRFGNSAARALDKMFNYRLQDGMKAMLFSEGRLACEMQANITKMVTEGHVFNAKLEVPTETFVECGVPGNMKKCYPKRWLNITVSPLSDEAGSVDGMLIAKEDITDEVNAAKALEDAKEMAEASSRAKSEFLANMSHEIRTPMTAILGYADLLDSEDSLANNPAQTADAVQTIRTNANHLLTIINDILDMSKIEAGKMTVEQIDTSPAQIVEEVVSLMRPRAIGKGLKLCLDYEGSIPETIHSDPTRLRQILLNLVGNAIKFTEVGEITIRTSVDVQRQKVSFRVDDTGIGMSPEQCDRISQFEAFSQADGSMTRQFGGTGLGLRISNSLAKILGGGITIASELGRGSSFTAIVSTGNLAGVPMLVPECVPVQGLNEIPTKAVSKTSDSLPLEGLTILLAEDGPDNQRLIAFHLKKAGAIVEIADNGRIAMQMVQKDPGRFQVIFMDMQMPELDGYGATRRLREWGYPRPIIALTAHAMDGDRQKCLEAGCDDYTTKPINRLVLIELAQKYGRSVASQPATTIPPTVVFPAGDGHQVPSQDAFASAK